MAFGVLVALLIGVFFLYIEWYHPRQILYNSNWSTEENIKACKDGGGKWYLFDTDVDRNLCQNEAARIYGEMMLTSGHPAAGCKCKKEGHCYNGAECIPIEEYLASHPPKTNKD